MSTRVSKDAMRSDLAHRFEAQFQVLLFACITHSLIGKKEQAIYIMQGTEEINLSVSAFNHR